MLIFFPSASPIAVLFYQYKTLMHFTPPFSKIGYQLANMILSPLIIIINFLIIVWSTIAILNTYYEIV